MTTLARELTIKVSVVSGERRIDMSGLFGNAIGSTRVVGSIGAALGGYSRNDEKSCFRCRLCGRPAIPFMSETKGIDCLCGSCRRFQRLIDESHRGNI